LHEDRGAYLGFDCDLSVGAQFSIRVPTPDLFYINYSRSRDGAHMGILIDQYEPDMFGNQSPIGCVKSKSDVTALYVLTIGPVVAHTETRYGPPYSVWNRGLKVWSLPTTSKYKFVLEWICSLRTSFADNVVTNAANVLAENWNQFEIFESASAEELSMKLGLDIAIIYELRGNREALARLKRRF